MQAVSLWPTTCQWRSVEVVSAEGSSHGQLDDALRGFGEAYGQLARAFAATAGLHSTDATALIEILRAEELGEPLSPVRLSERIGLTTGATSTLLNRLENAGHVVRKRGHSDRRAVTIHSTEGIHAFADAFFDPLSAQIGSVLGGYGPAELRLFVEMLDKLQQTLVNYRPE